MSKWKVEKTMIAKVRMMRSIKKHKKQSQLNNHQIHQRITILGDFFLRDQMALNQNLKATFNRLRLKK